MPHQLRLAPPLDKNAYFNYYFQSIFLILKEPQVLGPKMNLQQLPTTKPKTQVELGNAEATMPMLHLHKTEI